MQLFKKITLRKGSDVLGFAMILPAICIIIFAVIVIAQLCMCKQSLEYALYQASRAATICEDYDTACVTMESVAKSTLIDSSFGLTDGDIHCTLKLIAGTSSTPGSASASSGITWEKGALAECTIEININKLLDIGGDTMRATMYVMVERPAHTY